MIAAPAASMTRKPMRMLALGAWLATRGPSATVAIVLAGLSAAGASIAAFAMARADSATVEQLPTLAAYAIAWGAGIMLAFAAALRAVHRDQEQGVLDLARARGLGVGGYLGGRVGGLVVVLATVVGGATLVAALAATSAAHGSAPVVRSGFAALAYALAFAATVGPVAFASLGARTRAGGYLTLLAVLAVPELLAPWTSDLLPRGWHELTSIPSALNAVRDGVASPRESGGALVRALLGLVAVVAMALAVAGARMQNRDEVRAP